MYYPSTLVALTALMSGAGVLAAPSNDLFVRADTNPKTKTDPKTKRPPGPSSTTGTKIDFGSQDDFSQNFKIYGGTWKVDGDKDVYATDTLPQGGSKAVLINPFQGDYEYSVNIMIVNNTGPNGNAGIIYLARDFGVGTDVYSGFYTGFNTASNPPTLVTGKATNKGPQGEWKAQNVVPAPSINIGEWHKLKVVAKTVVGKDNKQRGEIDVYLRDQKVDTISTESQSKLRSEPQVGMRLFHAEARYDDFRYNKVGNSQSSTQNSKPKGKVSKPGTNNA